MADALGPSDLGSYNGTAPESATVELKIPCQAEYIGVARLVILGVASRTPFSYDEVEDLRLAVGEACTSAIDRAESTGAPNAEIVISCRTEPDRLILKVSDNLSAPSNGTSRAASSGDSPEEQSIGALLMEILVDEIQMESDPQSGTQVTMTKYLGR